MSPNLFEFAEKNKNPNETEIDSQAAPLAHRMRPQNLNEFSGQDRILGKGKPLRQSIESDKVPSLIFWGPPGCGKTTLAQLIASQTHSDFIALSAVLSGVKEIKEVVARAKDLFRQTYRKTILFIDEIHRFNKTQQDALLPHVENGTVTLIGATTENPSFEINSALLSRTRVIRFDRLDENALIEIIKKAIIDPNRGLGNLFEFTQEIIQRIAQISEGDARRALGTLEEITLYLSQSAHQKTQRKIDVPVLQEYLETLLQRPCIPYDKSAEEHYNVISAFIKSIRDSDPHAGLYYLARMLEGGEDPLFICRRLIILASEDVGNADPRALTLAISVKEAVEFVGLPEARINLAQAVTYLALAPKSNSSYLGINQALEEVKNSGALPIPNHLRNAVTSLMKQEGYARGYQYAHSEKNARVKQAHLPKPLVGRRFYSPKDSGLEKQLKEKLDRLNPDFD